jgi:hypothetical protein
MWSKLLAANPNSGRVPGHAGPISLAAWRRRSGEQAAWESATTHCLICGRHLTWLRRRLGFVLCLSRECRTAFDEREL